MVQSVKYQVISVEKQDSDIVGATEARVREIALQSMIEATLQARIGRELKASTKHPGETIYKPGDLVEYHRESSQKDVSGWLGPADVLEVLADQGQLLVKHRGEKIRCRCQDARHCIGLEVLLPELMFWNAQEAILVLQKYISAKEVGSAPTLFGYTVTPSGEWVLTRVSHRNSLVLEALNHLVLSI